MAVQEIKRDSRGWVEDVVVEEEDVDVGWEARRASGRPGAEGAPLGSSPDLVVVDVLEVPNEWGVGGTMRRDCRIRRMISSQMQKGQESPDQRCGENQRQNNSCCCQQWTTHHGGLKAHELFSLLKQNDIVSIGSSVFREGYVLLPICNKKIL